MELDPWLAEDQDAIVVESDSAVYALPTSMMWQPRVAGVERGGRELAVTYCVLTNSAVAFSPVIGGQRAGLKVFMQTHNNLLLRDENSGETIQPLERRTTSGTPLDTHPTRMMPWSAFKTVYPQGRVLFNPVRGLRENFVDLIFGPPPWRAINYPTRAAPCSPPRTCGISVCRIKKKCRR